MKNILQEALKEKQDKLKNDRGLVRPDKETNYRKGFSKGKQQTKPFKK